jgi:hypothetical protein
MSLMLVATEVGAVLVSKIRNRIAEGAPVWEVAGDEVSALFAEVGEEIKVAFQSEVAVVAVLESGRTVVRRLAVA